VLSWQVPSQATFFNGLKLQFAASMCNVVELSTLEVIWTHPFKLPRLWRISCDHLVLVCPYSINKRPKHMALAPAMHGTTNCKALMLSLPSLFKPLSISQITWMLSYSGWLPYIHYPFVYSSYRSWSLSFTADVSWIILHACLSQKTFSKLKTFSWSQKRKSTRCRACNQLSDVYNLLPSQLIPEGCANLSYTCTFRITTDYLFSI